MTDGAGYRRPAGNAHHRYSLRTLFVISVSVAVPLLVVANFRSGTRPDDSLASPLYLFVGVAGVLVSAAIGNALAGTAGLLVTGATAGLVWIGVVFLCGEFSSTLRTLLPVHVAAVVLTIGGLAAAVRFRREVQDDGPHEMLVRLLKVKSNLRVDRSGSKSEDDLPASDGNQLSDDNQPVDQPLDANQSLTAPPPASTGAP